MWEFTPQDKCDETPFYAYGIFVHIAIPVMAWIQLAPRCCAPLMCPDKVPMVPHPFPVGEYHCRNPKLMDFPLIVTYQVQFWRWIIGSLMLVFPENGFQENCDIIHSLTNDSLLIDWPLKLEIFAPFALMLVVYVAVLMMMFVGVLLSKGKHAFLRRLFDEEEEEESGTPLLVGEPVQVDQEINQLMDNASLLRKEVADAKKHYGEHSTECQDAKERVMGRLKELESRIGPCLDRLLRKERFEYYPKTCLFVSGPEYDDDHAPALCFARCAMQTMGMFNVAGDAQDQFHAEVMDEEEMTITRAGWRIAWKGKVSTGIHFSVKLAPSKPVELWAINGGPECQLEIQKLEQKIKPAFQAEFEKRGTYIKIVKFKTWKEMYKRIAGF
jgi:hypothetical protein